MNADAFIRQCWNERINGDDFLERVLSTYQGITPDFICHLASICGTSGNFFPELIDYLLALFTHDIALSTRSIQIDDQNQINGCILMFIRYGDRIFNTEKHGEIENCAIAIKVLEICSVCADKEQKFEALFTLSRSPILSINIATARYFKPDEFNRIQGLFKDINILESKRNVTQLQKLFDYALKTDKVIQQFHNFSKFEFISFYSSAIRITRTQHLIPRHSGLVFYKVINLALMNSFLDHPSLTDAVLITTILPQFFYLRVKNQDPNVHIKVFNKEVFISALKSQSSKNCFPAGCDEEKLIEIFTRMPESVDYDNLLETIFNFPAYSYNFLEPFKAIIQSDNLQRIKKIIADLEKNILDIVFYIKQMDQYQEYFSLIFDQMIQNQYDLEKYSILSGFFFLLIKNFKRSGCPYEIDQIKKFTNNKEATNPLEIYSLRYFNNDNFKMSENQNTFAEIMNERSNLIRTNIYINYLLKEGEKDYEEIKNILTQFPYLWPMTFVWGSRQPKLVSQHLIKIKFPDTELNNFLFSQMMLLVRGPITTLLFSNCDYEILISMQNKEFFFEPSNTPTPFLFPLDSWMFASNLYSMIIILRSWLTIFGPVKLVEGSFSMINRSHLLLLRDKLPGELLISYAFVMSIVCDDQVSIMMEIMRCVENILTENINLIKDGERLAYFCLAIVIANSEGSEERMDFVLDLCKRILANKKDETQIRIDFAHNFIRKAIYLPDFHDRIPIELMELLVIKGDYKGLVDFFIIRSRKLENPSNHEYPVNY
ncbi:hypothetical protein TVAG_124730 [Trichomonas vaginalis G3]|uniref:Uncharacterized protein n=1 Tax=Trichomonas vaginalis (strain ATCC PRA-98 / G3) TaxID=412133 RepID=A2EIH9_TRIV3|nr:hypothetical protein TVAGG3_0200100 [Trichomonas vaginalis G3]EAY07500.1 hypothetical protein TVAG_124730 [Trichomonas vaginalis G3]KAI5550547.1 hypothetical protein TVAGG3_0200100 [Trichomonas vaginalis G3]|eukprot:XP_001319723.1 hypothetical protein [Trichomonas vaginalis G3]